MESVGYRRRRVGAMVAAALAVIAASVVVGASDWAVGCAISVPVATDGALPASAAGFGGPIADSAAAELGDRTGLIDDPAIKVAFVGRLASISQRPPLTRDGFYGAGYDLRFEVDRVGKGEVHQSEVVRWTGVCYAVPDYVVGERYQVLGPTADRGALGWRVGPTSLLRSAYASWHDPLPGADGRSWWGLDRLLGGLAVGFVVAVITVGIVLVRRRGRQPAPD